MKVSTIVVGTMKRDGQGVLAALGADAGNAPAQ